MVVGHRLTGQVKWFSGRRGYGFIIAQDGREYFVHYRNIASDASWKLLEEGQRVIFSVNYGINGKLYFTKSRHGGVGAHTRYKFLERSTTDTVINDGVGARHTADWHEHTHNRVFSELAFNPTTILI